MGHSGMKFVEYEIRKFAVIIDSESAHAVPKSAQNKTLLLTLSPLFICDF